MKRVMTGLLALTLALSLTACGGKTEENPQTPDAPETPTVTTETEAPTSAPTQPDTEDSVLTETYQVPLYDICVNVPPYQQINEGFTEVFIIHQRDYVTFTAHQNATAKDAREAFDVASELFVINMENYDGTVNGITVQQEQIMTVNGREVYRFEGKLHCGRDTPHDSYGVGYAFVMDGLPCMILGSVTQEDQSQELIDGMRDMVDEMITTLRSQP